MKTKLKKILVYSTVAGVLLLGGGYAGWRGYKSARQARLVKQAREYLAKPDPRKALLCLQRALRYNARDIEAARLMAQLTEASRSPAALIWRSRVVELNPRSVDDRLALAQTAIAFRDYASATNALEGVDPAGRNTAAYHNIAGSVAAAARQSVQAELHFLEAARLEPQNSVLQLNLSVVRLHGTNAQALAEARNALQQISANPTNSVLRCQALRELTLDAMRYKYSDTALTLSKRLLQETNSVFPDRILRLEVLRDTKSAEFNPALREFQREAATNAGNIYELGMWQMAKLGPSESLTWLQSLPSTTRTNLPAVLFMAECRVVLRDWSGLQTSLSQQNWAELDFIRRAFNTRALRGQELTGAAKAEWELALKAASIQKGSLVMLLRLAAQWNWQSEGEELLWTIVNRYSDEKWASQALSQVLYQSGRTRPLMTLYSQEVKRSPSNLAIKNNLAMTAFLLEAKELKPHELAREVYEKSPTNAAFASTYAFSLHLQKKDAEALKIFLTLKPQELQHPAIAGYYSLVLRAVGDKEKARTYLERAFKGEMLPEERKLFEKVKRELEA